METSSASPVVLTSLAGGKPLEGGGNTTPLVSPVDLSIYAHLSETPESAIEAVVRGAQAAYEANRRATAAQRSQWLKAAADAIAEAGEELIALLISDIGKPRRLATVEVNRSVDFARACAAEILRVGGETLPLDAVAAGAGRMGFTRRVPYGVVAAVTPFNAPINLLMQKVAPALAAGNSVVVKPHPAGTRVALRVARAFAKAGLPAGLLSVITGDKAAAAALVRNRRVMAVSFTGGTAAGDALARAAGAKKFVAELGANSANVVLADADVGDAAKRIAAAAFEASGQQCVSAQRIIVETPVYEAFLAAFTAAAKALKVGDAAAPETDVGPMVSLAAAKRVMEMAEDAVRRGGRMALEPQRKECIVSPGILVDAPRDCSLWRDEAFGPLALVERAASPEEALRLANDSPFGLQGSVFTRSLKWAMRFSQDFDVGAMWVNEASRFRLDVYPFGGSKGSGFGREGVRYAIEELSQIKFTGLRFED
jgi:acyl-CoA reductase-like NAD-dependent aldehyde dehydrogenase